jgi:hypothetical protein
LRERSRGGCCGVSELATPRLMQLDLRRFARGVVTWPRRLAVSSWGLECSWVCSKIVSVAEAYRRHVAPLAAMNNRCEGGSSTQNLCVNACRTTGLSASSGTAVVWEVASSASEKRPTRIHGWKTFPSLGSRGVGASRVERALAFRAVLGNQRSPGGDAGRQWSCCLSLYKG